MDKNIRILIVDDFSTMRRIVKNLLNDIGLTNTTEADDGTTALVELKKASFDLVVTDWNMPGMPGLQLSQPGAANGLTAPAQCGSGNVCIVAHIFLKRQEKGVVLEDLDIRILLLLAKGIKNKNLDPTLFIFKPFPSLKKLISIFLAGQK